MKLLVARAMPEHLLRCAYGLPLAGEETHVSHWHVLINFVEESREECVELTKKMLRGVRFTLV